MFIAFPSLLLSQGYYVQRGQNAFGIETGYSSNKDASSFGGSLGYSAKGIFDIGLSISQISFVQQLAGEVLSATSLVPSITVHAIKQSEINPFSIAISVSYESDSYSSAALDQNYLKLTADGYTVGATVYGDIETSPTVKVQPSVGLTYFSTTAELKDTYSNSLTTKDDGTVVRAGFALLFQTNEKTILGIRPSIGIHKSESSFLLNAGIIFAL
jgi:hypothetical protein